MRRQFFLASFTLLSLSQSSWGQDGLIADLAKQVKAIDAANQASGKAMQADIADLREQMKGVKADLAIQIGSVQADVKAMQADLRAVKEMLAKTAVPTIVATTADTRGILGRRATITTAIVPMNSMPASPAVIMAPMMSGYGIGSTMMMSSGRMGLFGRIRARAGSCGAGG